MSKETYHQQVVLAYADDTTWIARSKTELQAIINTAYEFYKLNDIKINSKKSELLIFNANGKAKRNEEYYMINIGKKEDTVYAKNNTSLYRHLGV